MSKVGSGSDSGGTGSGDSKSTLYCSFCGKSQHEVRKLIAGPTVFIVMNAWNCAWNHPRGKQSLIGENR